MVIIGKTVLCPNDGVLAFKTNNLMTCSPAFVQKMAAPPSERAGETKVRQKTDKGDWNTELLLSLPFKSNQRQKIRLRPLGREQRCLLLSLIKVFFL